jgi:hypothetical protein
MASRHLHPPVYPCSFEKPGYFLVFPGPSSLKMPAAATTVRTASFGTFVHLNKGPTGVTDSDQFSFWFQYTVFVTNRTQQENSSFAQK